MQPFIHLHVHSQYSVLDGQASIKALVDKAIANGMKGIALTDHGNMFGIKEFYNYCNSINSGTEKDIKVLKKQIADQEASIARLTEELRKAHIEIQVLNTAVDSLNVANQTITEEKVAAEEKSEQLVNELNTCYYVIGSKNELKENKIIETGFLRKTKVLEGDYEINYFTKGDKRTLTEIPLHSKKAKIYTKHPEGTYEIVDNDGVKSLLITDPTRFWSLSNFLVIQID